MGAGFEILENFFQARSTQQQQSSRARSSNMDATGHAALSHVLHDATSSIIKQQRAQINHFGEELDEVVNSSRELENLKSGRLSGL